MKKVFYYAVMAIVAMAIALPAFAQAQDEPQYDNCANILKAGPPAPPRQHEKNTATRITEGAINAGLTMAGEAASRYGYSQVGNVAINAQENETRQREIAAEERIRDNAERTARYNECLQARSQDKQTDSYSSVERERIRAERDTQLAQIAAQQNIAFHADDTQTCLEQVRAARDAVNNGSNSVEVGRADYETTEIVRIPDPNHPGSYINVARSIPHMDPCKVVVKANKAAATWDNIPVRGQVSQ